MDDPEERASTLELLEVSLLSSITAKGGLKGCSFREAKILFKNNWYKSLSDYVAQLGFADEIELMRNLKKIRLDYSGNELWTFPCDNNVDTNRIISLIERTKPKIKNRSRSNPPPPIRQFFTPRTFFPSSTSRYSIYNAPNLNRPSNYNFNNRRDFSQSYHHNNNASNTGTGGYPVRNFNSSKSFYHNNNNTSFSASAGPSQMTFVRKGKVLPLNQVQPPTFGRSLVNPRNMNGYPTPNSNFHHSSIFPPTPSIKSEVKEQDVKQIVVVRKEHHPQRSDGKLLTSEQIKILEDFESKLFSSISTKNKLKGWTIGDSKKLFWNDWKKTWDSYMKALQFANEIDLLGSLKKVQLELKGGIYYLIPIITKTDLAAEVNAMLGKPVLDNNANIPKVIPRFDPPQQSSGIRTFKTSPNTTCDDYNNFNSSGTTVSKEMSSSSANGPLSLSANNANPMIKQEVLVEEDEEDLSVLDYEQPIAEDEEGEIEANDVGLVGMDEVNEDDPEIRTLIKEFNKILSAEVSSSKGRPVPAANPFAISSSRKS